MANKQSPGTYLTESDISKKVRNLSGAPTLVVFRSSRGPANEKVHITSQADLIDRFGHPDPVHGFSLYSAYFHLASGPIIAYRVVDEVSAKRSTALTDSGIPLFLPPIVEAGVPQIVSGSTVVLLDGTQSAAADSPIVSYQWSQVSGPSIAINNSTLPNASFTTPLASPVEDTTIVIRLSATDADGDVGTDDVIITVEQATRDLSAYIIFDDPLESLGTNEDYVIGNQTSYAIFDSPTESLGLADGYEIGNITNYAIFDDALVSQGRTGDQIDWYSTVTTSDNEGLIEGVNLVSIDYITIASNDNEGLIEGQTLTSIEYVTINTTDNEGLIEGEVLTSINYSSLNTDDNEGIINV